MKAAPKDVYIVSGIILFTESEKARKKRQRRERLAVFRMVLWPHTRTGSLLRIASWMLLVYMTIVGWFASLETGEAMFLRVPIALWGMQLAFGIATSLNAWRHHVAYTMYFDDIERGACLDRGAQIAERNAWAWYVKQGKPLWIRREDAPHID
jgi:hypothetical protein